MTVNLLQNIAHQLQEYDMSPQEAQAESKIILSHYLRLPYNQVFLQQKKPTEEEISSINRAVERRKTGEPLGYILQKWHFYGEDFEINNECLIPRLDSEILAEKAIENARNRLLNDECNEYHVLDICCGSGCLGVVAVKEICQKFPYILASLTMVDISQKALEIAKKNAEFILGNSVKITTKICDILKTNNLENLVKSADLILYNPPYIPTKDIENLEAQVKNFEPKIALDGGQNGLVFYEKIAHILMSNMKKNAVFACEFGINQSESVKSIFHNFANLKIHQDLCNIPRCAIFINN